MCGGRWIDKMDQREYKLTGNPIRRFPQYLEQVITGVSTSTVAARAEKQGPWSRYGRGRNNR